MSIHHLLLHRPSITRAEAKCCCCCCVRCTIEFLDILGERMKAENTPEPAKQKMAVIGQCIEVIMQQRMAK